MLINPYFMIMQNKLTMMLMVLLSCIQAFAQDIKVSVRLEEDPAAYSFISLNGRVVASCDSLGICIIPERQVAAGDTISASYAGVYSNSVLFDPGIKEYELTLMTGNLPFAVVSGDEILRWDEYYALVRRFRVPYPMKYIHVFDYESRATLLQTQKGYKESGMMRLYFKQVPAGERYYVQLEGSRVPYITNTCAFNVYYPYTIFRFLTRISSLEKLRKRGKILIHKVVDEQKNPCYFLIDRADGNNQTFIKFDGTTKEVLEVRREYSGDVIGIDHYRMTIVPANEGPVLRPLEVTQTAEQIERTPDAPKIYWIHVRDIRIFPVTRTDWKRIKSIMEDEKRERESK